MNTGKKNKSILKAIYSFSAVPKYWFIVVETTQKPFLFSIKKKTF